VTDEVRLSSGHLLYVWAGPLLRDGAWWYRVQDYPQAPGEDPDEEWAWGTAEGDLLDAGWVAGAVGDQAYLVVDGRPQPYPPPTPWWTMHGVGSAKSAIVDFPALDEGAWNPIGVEWYAADPEGQDCHIAVTMEPDGWDMGSQVIHDWGSGGGVTPPEEMLLGEKWVEVDSDCSWTVVGVAQNG
jgi:hypothetical protein